MKKSIIALSLLLLISLPAQALRTINPNEKTEQSETQRLAQAQKLAQQNDWQSAFNIVKQLALEGSLTSQTNLGLFYKDGRGTAVDNEKALWWLNEAAERGSVKAVHILAMMYLFGDHVKQDEGHAIKLLKHIADKESQADVVLGKIYYEKKDYRSAMKWLKKAIELNNNDGRFLLGLMYQIGKGTKSHRRDPQKAIQLYQDILESDNASPDLKRKAERQLNELQ